MKPHFTTIQDGKAALADMWLSYDILPEIDKIKGVVSERIDTLTPDEISRAVVKLSVLLCSLGGLVAQIVSEANEGYIFRKFMYAWEFTTLKSDIKGAKAESLALQNTIEHHRSEMIKRFISDYMKAYKDDIERLVSSMQSRLKTLQSERINSNNQT